MTKIDKDAILEAFAREQRLQNPMNALPRSHPYSHYLDKRGNLACTWERRLTPNFSKGDQNSDTSPQAYTPPLFSCSSALIFTF